MTQTHFTALRKFVRAREPEEACDLCFAALPSQHAHQFSPVARRVRCICYACERLGGAGWQTVPRRVKILPGLCFTDAQWEDLRIPISLAFFSYSTPAGRIMALYPGPAGAAESLLPLDTWKDIASPNPMLLDMQADVEALLVNRVGSARDHFLVPVDECYRLVGLVRLHWRGLSGGSLVWGEISSFFDSLRRRTQTCPS
jgi:hypothetical protein